MKFLAICILIVCSAGFSSPTSSPEYWKDEFVRFADRYVRNIAGDTPFVRELAFQREKADLEANAPCMNALSQDPKELCLQNFYICKHKFLMSFGLWPLDSLKSLVGDLQYCSWVEIRSTYIPAGY